LLALVSSLSRRWLRRLVVFVLAIAIVGGGSSVAATVLLTEAFQHGDPTTPLLLQKLQPVIVALLASVLLSERLRPRNFAYLAAALASSYLIAFADPTQVTVDRLVPALPGAGAAALVALCASFLGSYVRARGNSLDYRVEESMFTRAARYGLVVLALGLDLAVWVLWALAAVTLLASVVRASQVAKEERA